MLTRPWWERHPGRLEHEFQALRDASIPYEQDEAAFAKGRLVLRLRPTLRDGETITLEARFPAMYPYERFEVYAPGLDLPYHQNPFQKNLCLIGQATENWRVGDTLTRFIREQLPKLLEAVRAAGRVDADQLEEHQGEPFSAYYPYQDGAMLLVDGGWQFDPSVKTGQLRIGLPEGTMAGGPLRGAVLEVRDQAGRVLARADSGLARLFPKQVTGRWVRAPQPIRQGHPSPFVAEAASLDARLRQPMPQPLGPASVDILGVIFPEEHGWRPERLSDGWVFLVHTLPRSGKGKKSITAAFVRAGRAGREDLAARVPEIRALAERRVALFGLGGLGAPGAVELARAGVGDLRLLDGDYVDPATGRRWQLGIPAAGLDKVAALKGFLEWNYPYTRVTSSALRLGEPEAGPLELETLERMLDNVDLVYDATAERGLQHLLSDLARERDIPYMCLWATPGAWGGVVARVRPAVGGCWMCLQYALTDGTICSPPADPAGSVQPAGCASPTFTGTAFDLQQVALTAVRLAVSTLTSDDASGYPDAPWGVGVLSLRDPASGRQVPPTWVTYPLERHPECLVCARNL